MQNVKCKCCFKLLAKIGTFDRIEIKCPRCKTLNNFQSTQSALHERQNERHIETGKIDEQYFNTAVQS